MSAGTKEAFRIILTIFVFFALLGDLCGFAVKISHIQMH
jgi:hypothetical protein